MLNGTWNILKTLTQQVVRMKKGIMKSVNGKHITTIDGASTIVQSKIYLVEGITWESIRVIDFKEGR
jgi:hypothetical protein